MDMTQALHQAQQNADMSMMGGPNASRIDASMAMAPAGTDTPTADGEPTAEGGETPAEGEEGEPAAEGEGETTDETKATVETPLPELPNYDKNAMEDLAPAMRLRINQAIAQREREEKQRLIEELIA